jgi:hypothetical protein
MSDEYTHETIQKLLAEIFRLTSERDAAIAQLAQARPVPRSGMRHEDSSSSVIPSLDGEKRA